MEENRKSNIKRIAKYFREVSVVVIGVAVTFTLSDWISSSNEKKDLHRYLSAIKLELEENLPIIQNDVERYQLAQDFSRYLGSADFKNLHADSIRKYISVLGDAYAITYNTGAFEMLKSSGAMRLIKDDVLLLAIINSYTSISEAVAARDRYYRAKEDVLLDAVLNKGLNLRHINFSDSKWQQILEFYAIDMDIVALFKYCAIQIEKTLTLFR